VGWAAEGGRCYEEHPDRPRPDQLAARVSGHSRRRRVRRHPWSEVLSLRLLGQAGKCPGLVSRYPAPRPDLQGGTVGRRRTGGIEATCRSLVLTRLAVGTDGPLLGTGTVCSPTAGPWSRWPLPADVTSMHIAERLQRVCHCASRSGRWCRCSVVQLDRGAVGRVGRRRGRRPHFARPLAVGSVPPIRAVAVAGVVPLPLCRGLEDVRGTGSCYAAYHWTALVCPGRATRNGQLLDAVARRELLPGWTCVGGW